MSTSGLFGEVGSWAVGLAIMAAAVVYQEELRAIGGELLGASRLEQQVAGKAARVKPTPTRAELVASSNSIVELQAGRDGHYHATAEINGRSIEVLVDTGASMVAMPYEDAERAGIYVKDADFTARASTANGLARMAPVILDRVSIGDITVRNVKAAVMEPGKLGQTLLGMSFLGRLQRADMRSGVLLLQE